MPHFAHQRNGFQPTKAFFDALPLLLADDIAPQPRGATKTFRSRTFSRATGRIAFSLRSGCLTPAV